MPTRRTATVIAVIATLLMAIAAPAGAATETTSRGTAATTSIPLQVTASDLQAKLGEVSLLSTTDGDTDERAPWSMVGLTLADLGGATFGDLRVTSDGDTTNPGQSFGQSTALGSVGATAAKLLAIADDTAGSATAAVTSLETNATVLENTAAPEGLGLSAQVTDVVSSVDGTGAAATHTLALADIDLNLAHVLGSVLDELPLEDLLELAGILGIDTADLGLDSVSDLVTATEELVAAVTAAVTASDTVVSAADALATADGGRLAELEGFITELETIDLTITTERLLTDIVADINDVLTQDGFPEDCADVVDLDSLSLIDAAVIQTIVDCLETEIETHLETLAEELAALQTAVDNYLAALTDVATAITAGENAADALDITDIIAQIEALIAGLLDADLAGIGEIEVSQQVRAIGDSLEGSSASHTCRATTLQALAGDPVDIIDCDGGDVLGPVIDTITTTLSSALDTVGGVDAGDGVVLELFGNTEDTVSETDDGYVRATSVLEVLRLTIPDITVSACEVADDLVCGLGIDIDDTLTSVLGGLAAQLADGQTAASGAVQDISDLLDALGAGDLVTDITGADVPDVTTVAGELETALDSLLDAVTELGLGAASGTVRGAEIVVDPQLEAEHQVTTATVDDPAPADPAPDSPDDDPTLPNTGGGAALLAVLALGAGTWLWRSRRDEA